MIHTIKSIRELDGNENRKIEPGTEFIVRISEVKEHDLEKQKVRFADDTGEINCRIGSGDFKTGDTLRYVGDSLTRKVYVKDGERYPYLGAFFTDFEVIPEDELRMIDKSGVKFIEHTRICYQIADDLCTITDSRKELSSVFATVLIEARNRGVTLIYEDIAESLTFEEMDEYGNNRRP